MDESKTCWKRWVGGFGRESFAQEFDLSAVVSREVDHFKKVTKVTGFVRDEHNCRRKRIVPMCACVSVGVEGEEVGVFYSGFAEKKIDPHGKPVPGQRKQPSHVWTRISILPVTVRSRLFLHCWSTAWEFYGKGEGNACCITPPAFRRRSTDAPLRSHHSRSLPLSPTEQTLANYIRR